MDVRADMLSRLRNRKPNFTLDRAFYSPAAPGGHVFVSLADQPADVGHYRARMERYVLPHRPCFDVHEGAVMQFVDWSSNFMAGRLTEGDIPSLRSVA